ncbi:uncharacterized protein [Rutidosis leptorrhynchoides]|uniref:uncharacterized protein n=1 Tax=Rutidosis leptorrhynchoides TaxID=125765 RepID=UPI003A995AE6
MEEAFRILELRDIIKNHIYEANDGTVQWISKSGKVGPYKTSQVWEDLKPIKPRVHWHHVIWFTQANPKHVFILWLANLDRLTTQDKLVWNEVKKYLLFKGLPDKLQNVVNSLAEFPFRNQIWDIINRLSVTAAVYHIWNERNCRMFRGRRRSEMNLIMVIIDGIKLKLTTLIVKRSNAIRVAEKNWGLILKGNRLFLKDG